MGDDPRRLEGLIAPGAWDINPSWTPQQILATLVGESATRYAELGLGTAPDGDLRPIRRWWWRRWCNVSPSPQDFAKVARVIYNRLTAPDRRLEFDSTVNYPLDRQEVATTDADRAPQLHPEHLLPRGTAADPICSPGEPALAAAERPEPGDWLYFVTVRFAGHHPVHPGLPGASRQHRARQRRIGVLDQRSMSLSGEDRGAVKAAVLGSPIAHSDPRDCISRPIARSVSPDMDV